MPALPSVADLVGLTAVRGLLRGRLLPGANRHSSWSRTAEWQDWPAPRNLVREGHHQRALYRVVGRPCEAGYLVPVDARLLREPRNRYDRNAIQVFVGRHMVGYIERRAGSRLARAMDRSRCRSFTCCAVIRGGRLAEADKIGIHLWLDRRVSGGPAVSVGRHEAWEVPWPPTARERQRCIARIRRAR